MPSRKQTPPQHGRRRSARQRKARYLVVAGGAVTEKQYFAYLADLYDVVIDYRQKNLAPSQLAKMAVDIVAKQGTNTGVDAYQQVWVVVDVDDFHDLAQAERVLRSEPQTKLIVSNPCFEVWLLSHLERVPCSVMRTKDVEKRAKAKGLTDGSGSKQIVISALANKLDAAVDNVTRGNGVGNQEGAHPRWDASMAPWTDMPQVVAYLDEHHQRGER